MKRHAALIVIVAVVLGVGAYAWAQGAPDRPTTTSPAAATAPAPSPAPGARRGARFVGPMRRAIHGDLLVPNAGGNGFRTVTFDRGTVTAVSGSSITVQRRDGQSVTDAINGQTRFRGVQSAGQVATGKPAVVVAQGGTAIAVAQRDPNRPAPATPVAPPAQ